LILSYQGLEEENLDQKSPGPPGWGLMQQVSSSLIIKKAINAKRTKHGGNLFVYKCLKLVESGVVIFRRKILCLE
jgi:hypothetical protein